MATIFDRLKKIVIDQLGAEVDQVGPSTSFTDDLNADSLDLVELVMAIEEEFSNDNRELRISDEEAEGLKTLQDTVDYLKEKGIEDE